MRTAIPQSVRATLNSPAMMALSLEAQGFWSQVMGLMNQGEPRGYLRFGQRYLTDRDIAGLVGGGASPQRVRKLMGQLAAAGIFEISPEGIPFSPAMLRERPGYRPLDVSWCAWVKLRQSTFERDGYACVYCGDADGPFECDHVNPVRLGGKSVLNNLACARGPCNRSKGGRTVEQWRGALA